MISSGRRKIRNPSHAIGSGRTIELHRLTEAASGRLRLLQPLTSLEIAALIAVIRLEGEAYGVSIHDDIESVLGRPVSTAAVYDALARLERRALLRTTLSAPLAVQGGRAKRLYEVTTIGRTLLRNEQVDATRLWQALPARFRRST